MWAASTNGGANEGQLPARDIDAEVRLWLLQRATKQARRRRAGLGVLRRSKSASRRPQARLVAIRRDASCAWGGRAWR